MTTLRLSGTAAVALLATASQLNMKFARVANTSPGPDIRSTASNNDTAPACRYDTMRGR